MNKNLLEWTVFGVSCALIVTVAGLLVHEQLTASDTPASIVVTAGDPVRTASGFAVPVDVRNNGDTTAEEVRIQGTLAGADGSERGEAVIDMVPYHSHRRAWISFAGNPAAGRLEVRVIGYRDP